MSKFLKLTLAATFMVALGWLIFSEDLNRYNRLPGDLPWSDASAYVGGAVEFAQTGQLTAWACRRPPQHLINAGILHFSAYDLGSLNNVLKYFTVLIGALMALLLARLYSVELAALVLVACFFFAKKQFWSTPLSENIGFFWGTISFMLFQLYWHESKKWWRLGLAIGVMWLAMYARASAILVPVILLGFGVCYQPKAERLKVFAKTIALILPFFILTAWTQNHLCQGVASFGNAAPTLYGMAKGGVGWTQVYQDFPQLKQLSDVEQNKFIKIEFVKNLLEAPWLFAKSYFNLLGRFLLTPEIWGRKSFDLILFVFALLVALRQWRRKADKDSFLQVAIFGAVLLTVPLLYDGAARVYSPVIAFMALFVAWPLWILGPKKYQTKISSHYLKFIEAKILFLLLASILLPAVLLQNQAVIKKTQPVSCANEGLPLNALVLGHAQLHLGNEAIADSSVRQVSPKDWQSGLQGNGMEPALLANTLNSNWFTLAINLKDFTPMYLSHQKKIEGQPWKKAVLIKGCVHSLGDSIFQFESASQD